MEQTADLKSKVDLFKEEYFSQNRKNTFFKNRQKMEIARKISESFDLNDLIQKTSFVIPNTNKIYIDYTVFKLYANENNYESILTHLIKLYMFCIEHYNSFEVHVNLQSLTPSATEKYKKCIELFNTMTSNCTISNYLTNWYVYNPPSMIDIIKHILTCVLDPLLMNKVTVFTKLESPDKMNQLFNVPSNVGPFSNCPSLERVVGEEEYSGEETHGED
jgi:hypothetical protein